MEREREKNIPRIDVKNFWFFRRKRDDDNNIFG
jgi:hypothetical protein